MLRLCALASHNAKFWRKCRAGIGGEAILRVVWCYGTKSQGVANSKSRNLKRVTLPVVVAIRALSIRHNGELGLVAEQDDGVTLTTYATMLLGCGYGLDSQPIDKSLGICTLADVSTILHLHIAVEALKLLWCLDTRPVDEHSCATHQCREHIVLGAI